MKKKTSTQLSAIAAAVMFATSAITESVATIAVAPAKPFAHFAELRQKMLDVMAQMAAYREEMESEASDGTKFMADHYDSLGLRLATFHAVDKAAYNSTIDVLRKGGEVALAVELEKTLKYMIASIDTLAAKAKLYTEHTEVDAIIAENGAGNPLIDIGQLLTTSGELVSKLNAAGFILAEANYLASDHASLLTVDGFKDKVAQVADAAIA
jgi:hypothetical protein